MKKTIAMLMTLALLISALAVPALAEETAGTTEPDTSAAASEETFAFVTSDGDLTETKAPAQTETQKRTTAATAASADSNGIRPRLGVSYVNALDFEQYKMVVGIRGLPSGTVVITEIDKDGSLADTNVQTGDMIIKVDGKDLTTSDVLLDKINNGRVGDRMTLTVCRVDSDYNYTQFDVTAALIE